MITNKKKLVGILLSLAMTMCPIVENNSTQNSMITSIVVSAKASENNTQTLANDINQDGIVNVLDTLELKKHIIKGETSNNVDLIQTKRASFGLDNFSYYNDGIYDEYIPFDDDIFNYEIYDNQVWVVIKHQYSDFNKVWTAEDFPVDNIDYVDDLTVFAPDEFANAKPLNKVLILYLKNHGVENVVKMVNDLENANMVEIQKIVVQDRWYPIED